MIYETFEEAEAAFERLMQKGVINYTYYIEGVEGGYRITTWDYNENWD